MPQYTLKASAEDKGKRLDLLLVEFATSRRIGFSRTYLKELILEGKVTLKGLPIKSPHYKAKENDEISIFIEERKPYTLEAEKIPIDIIYEDEDLAVINKQAGMVVHPAPGNYNHTLVNALLYHFKGLSDISPKRPGIVHRLDKDTSGIMVIAKNNFAHLALANQFAKHTIQRKYIALVKGRVEFQENIIELPIARHPYKRKNMSVTFSEKAKYAKTYYRILKRLKDATFLELKPFTGRTHQLRVHLAFLGHPILGDTKYGKNNEFMRLALHAQSLGFTHPRTNKSLEFTSNIPQEFEKFIQDSK